MMNKLILAFLIGVAGISGCSVNPVTGKRNFQVYGDEWEQQIGSQMYAPMKQSQGGEFILDPELTVYIKDVGRKLALRARRNEQLDFEFSVPIEPKVLCVHPSFSFQQCQMTWSPQQQRLSNP